MDPAERLASRVREFLDELEVQHESVGDGIVKIDVGTTAVLIEVEHRADRGIVGLVAPILVEVPERPERLVRLLGLNGQLSFGKFRWHPDDQAVSVEYELLGDFLDRDELQVALQAVGDIADTADEHLLQVLGGRLPRHG